MKKIILISGKQGSGKTTLAKGLVREIKLKTVLHVKFADALYELEKMIWSKMESYGVTPKVRPDKTLLQLLGTEWGRDTIDPDLWVKITRKKVDEIKEGVIVIDDSRFPNEFDYFPEAIKIRLECDRDIRKERTPVWRDNENHLSEVALDDYVSFCKFDLVLDTGTYNTKQALRSVIKFIGAEL